MSGRAYQLWQVRDFSPGQIEKISDNMLPDGAARECRNFIANKIGQLTVRPGQEKLNKISLDGRIQGLHHYYNPSTGNEELIVFVRGVGYTWDGDKFVEIYTPIGESSILGHHMYPLYKTALFGEPMYSELGAMDFSDYDDEAPMLMEDTVNYIVGMNGVEAPWKWDMTVISALANAPARGMYPVLHKESLFCVDAADPSVLRWSDPFAPETWPAPNYWNIRRDDGDEITNLVRFEGRLTIFKNRSIHILHGHSIEDFSMQELHPLIGCVGPRASTVSQKNLFFVSSWGIQVTDGVSIANVSDNLIPDTWDRVNKKHLDKIVIGTWKEKIWISLPMDQSTVNNLTLIYDPQVQAFWPMDNIVISCYEKFIDDEGLSFYTGGWGFVYKQDKGLDDFGNPIEAYWQGRKFDADFPEVEKKSRKAYLQCAPETETAISFAVSRDYEDYENLEYHRKEGLTLEYIFDIEQNRWRYLSPMISCVSSEGCVIRGLVVPFKPKTKLAVRYDE